MLNVFALTCCCDIFNQVAQQQFIFIYPLTMSFEGQQANMSVLLVAINTSGPALNLILISQKTFTHLSSRAFTGNHVKEKVNSNSN